MDLESDSGSDVEVIEETMSTSEIPLFLSETTFFSKPFKPSGPWKVLLGKTSSANESYKVLQTHEEIKQFGSIAQSTINLNSSGTAYITMKSNQSSKMIKIPPETRIGSVKITRPFVKDTICNAKYDLMASSNVELGIGESKWIHLVLTASLLMNKPLCVREYHGVNVSSHLLFLPLEIEQNSLRTVLMTGQSFLFKNKYSSPMMIKKGQKVAYASCCHGHYEDSKCFRPSAFQPIPVLVQGVPK